MPKLENCLEAARFLSYMPKEYQGLGQVRILFSMNERKHAVVLIHPKHPARMFDFPTRQFLLIPVKHLPQGGF